MKTWSFASLLSAGLLLPIETTICCLPCGQIAPRTIRKDLVFRATWISKAALAAVILRFSIAQVAGCMVGAVLVSYADWANFGLERASTSVVSSFHLVFTEIDPANPAQRAGGGIGSTTA